MVEFLSWSLFGRTVQEIYINSKANNNNNDNNNDNNNNNEKKQQQQQQQLFQEERLELEKCIDIARQQLGLIFPRSNSNSPTNSTGGAAAITRRVYCVPAAYVTGTCQCLASSLDYLLSRFPFQNGS
jgi:hypothetical protein